MTSIFMQIKGFKGNVTIPKYKDWIAIDNLEFGAGRPIKMNVGNLTDRDHSSLSFDYVTLLKHLDNASNNLFIAMCNASTFSQVEIHLCQGDKNVTPYAKFILEKVMVSKHHTETLIDANPIEEIKFAYTKIQRTYIKHDSMNKAQSPHIVGYDLETAKAV